MAPRPYCPDHGDIVWLTFEPQAGHEQAGRRPALTLSPRAYNRKAGLALFCPITSQVKGYPFEVGLPKVPGIGGVVLADQVKNLDWKARRCARLARAPKSVVQETLGKLQALLAPYAESEV
jgi:mRNA interferase MazF